MVNLPSPPLNRLLPRSVMNLFKRSIAFVAVTLLVSACGLGGGDGGFVRLAVASCLMPFLLSVYVVVLLALRDDYFGWWFAIFSPLQAIVDSAVGAALVVVLFRSYWFGSAESELA